MDCSVILCSWVSTFQEVLIQVQQWYWSHHRYFLAQLKSIKGYPVIKNNFNQSLSIFFFRAGIALSKDSVISTTLKERYLIMASFVLTSNQEISNLPKDVTIKSWTLLHGSVLTQCFKLRGDNHWGVSVCKKLGS